MQKDAEIDKKHTLNHFLANFLKFARKWMRVLFCIKFSTFLIFARLDTSYVVQDGSLCLSLNANVLSVTVSCRSSVGIEGVSQLSGVLSIIIDRFEWPLLVPPRSRQPPRTPNRSTIRYSSSTELIQIGKVGIDSILLSRIYFRVRVATPF